MNKDFFCIYICDEDFEEQNPCENCIIANKDGEEEIDFENLENEQ